MLGALKKALTERALNAEMDHHLAGVDGAGNTRNGYGRKTVTTETGSMAIEVPRDRQASFDPQLIAKYAAFPQASRVADDFVNFAFAVAGGWCGGAAKVAVFASGLMGMINAPRQAMSSRPVRSPFH